MAEYLIVSDAVSPVADGEPALAVAGLARALVAAKHRVTLLSVAPAEQASALPGMARRLRTVDVSAAGAAASLPLFEGRVALGQVQLYVLGATVGGNRGQSSSFLATAAAALVRDGLIKPDVVVGWGETGSTSLWEVGAGLRLFVLPTGTAAPPLSADERAALGSAAALEALEALSSDSLVALGVAGADVVVVPSPSSLRALENHPALSARASDQPMVAVRFGSDEPPHDPGSDPVLAAGFTAEAPAGRAECRRAMARRASLAVGSRTLILAVGPLTAAGGGREVLEALGRLVRLDVAIAVAGGGDRALTDRAAVLGIEHPGKLAVVADGAAGPGRRALLAGADAVLFTDVADQTGRAAALALRYGAVPVVPELGANADYLVDYDPESATGCALVYAKLAAFEIESAVRRALALRADATRWQEVTRTLLLAAPRWASAAAVIELMQPPPAPDVEVVPAAAPATAPGGTSEASPPLPPPSPPPAS